MGVKVELRFRVVSSRGGCRVIQLPAFAAAFGHLELPAPSSLQPEGPYMPPEYQLVLDRAWMDALGLIISVFMLISGVSLLVILTAVAVNLAGGWLSGREARARGAGRKAVASLTAKHKLRRPAAHARIRKRSTNSAI